MSSNPSSGSSIALQQCNYCNAAVNPEHLFCPVCKFPLKGTVVEQDKFIYQRGFKKEELKVLKSKTENAAIMLYIVAGLILLSGLIIFFISAQYDESVYIIAVTGILTIAFILLGNWSNKQPVPAIICAMVLYLLLFLFEVFNGVSTLASGLIIRISVVVVLVKALVSALKAKKIRKEYKL